MRTEITSGPEAGSGVPKASATGAAQLQTAAGPTRGGTAGLQQRLFPCLLWQGTKRPSLPRQVKAEADNPSAGCRSSSLPGSRTSTDTAYHTTVPRWPTLRWQGLPQGTRRSQRSSGSRCSSPRKDKTW